MISTIATGHMGHSVNHHSILEALECRVNCVVPLLLSRFIGFLLRSNGEAEFGWKGSGCRAAAGGIFRDHRGSIIRTYCFDIGVGTAFFVEISTVIHGIEYAH